jgi:predicted acyl esterase
VAARGAQQVTFYLGSGGKANTLNGDGALGTAAPDADKPDAFTYDPLNPVLSYGGNVCCTGTAVQAGSFDQRRMEAREDILVYTSEAFKEGTEVSGPIVPTLYVSSDAKDTDFTVKVLGRLSRRPRFNLDEVDSAACAIRDGYDKPLAWMESGKVLQGRACSPRTRATTSTRPQVSASRCRAATSRAFDRNLNTGLATTSTMSNARRRAQRRAHSKQYPSRDGNGGQRAPRTCGRHRGRGAGNWLIDYAFLTLPQCPSPDLFVSKRFHRVDLRRAARRGVARGEADDDEQHGRAGES